MRLLAKAALGALALASVAASTPAAAQGFSVQVGPAYPGAVVVPDRNPCFRPPEFRPMYCFRHYPRMGFGDWRNDRGAYDFNRPYAWDRDRERERERQAFLDRRFYDYDRRY